MIKRIMIIGQPGSGKSTLAQMLGDKTGLPVVHMDTIHWASGWVFRSDEERAARCARVHASEKWIFEGGFSKSWPERMARADMVIALDFPLYLRAWRVFWRRIKYHGKTRPDLPDGCPERLDPEFIAWIWNTRHSARKLIHSTLDKVPEDKIKICLRSRREVDKFLASFNEAYG